MQVFKIFFLLKKIHIHKNDGMIYVGLACKIIEILWKKMGTHRTGACSHT